MAATELEQLLRVDIPEGRKNLQGSYMNLEQVAAYCQENYLKAQDKRHALEETKDYTTRSLASVAYQINTLATNFLHMLDLQATQMAEMESNVNHLSQIVDIHKEKVARREIGVLTTNKTILRPPGMKNGIILPEATERPVKYVRKPIDFGELDHIGHGVQVQTLNPQNPRSTKPRSSSISSHSSNSSGAPSHYGTPAATSHYGTPVVQSPYGTPSVQSHYGTSRAPTQMPPTPPQPNVGPTISRGGGGSHYRTPNVPPPVAPPSVPGHYQSNYSDSGSNQSYDEQGGYPTESNMEENIGHQANFYQDEGGQTQRRGSGSQPTYAPVGHYGRGGVRMGQAPSQPPPAPPQNQPQPGQDNVPNEASEEQPTQQNPVWQHQTSISSVDPMYPPLFGNDMGSTAPMAGPMRVPQNRQSPPVWHQGNQNHNRQSITSVDSQNSQNFPIFGKEMSAPAPMAGPMRAPQARQNVPPWQTSAGHIRNTSVSSIDHGYPPPNPELDHYHQRQNFRQSMNASPPPPPPPGEIDTSQLPPPIFDSAGEYGLDTANDEDWIPKEYIERVLAIYEYNKDKDDELSFPENAVIYVIKKNDDGWYEGVMNGFRGLFPGNYVESLT